jgi:hypothetical protein
MWQAMQSPDWARTSWNASRILVVMGASGLALWQAVHGWKGELAGFSGLEAWWHVTHWVMVWCVT